MPHDIVDKSGKPILSWRVMLLPDAGLKDVYDRIDLTKPWDDPVHQMLLEETPSLYMLPDRAAPKGQTYVQSFSATRRLPKGNPAMVPGSKLHSGYVPDGMGSTLFAAEAADPVPWLKPADMPVTADKLPRLGRPGATDVAVLFMSCQAATLVTEGLTPRVLRGLITIDGGEVFEIPYPDVWKRRATAGPATPGGAPMDPDAQWRKNLEVIGLAIKNYQLLYDHYPMDVLDEKGKPILSWRVAILPFLEQENLYRQIDLKKRWDDPANQDFAAQTPKVFEVPGRPAGAGMTYVQSFSAPTRVARGNPVLVPGHRLKATDVKDGASRTVFAAEAADAVPWMKPGDLAFTPGTVPKLGRPGADRLLLLFADGKVRSVPAAKLTDGLLRSMITVDGGESYELPE